MKKTKLMMAVTAAAVMAALAIPAAHGAHIYADSSSPAQAIQAKKDRYLEVVELCNGILANAQNEGNRELSDDEQRDFDAYFAEGERLEADIDRMEKMQAKNVQLRGGVRPTENPAASETTPAASQSPAQAAATQRRASVPAQPRDTRNAGSWGFLNVADYLKSVLQMSAKGAGLDPRYVANAPTQFGSEGIGQDGGFAVPPDFRSTIITKVMGEDSLLSRTDQQTTSSNQITFPVDETTPWQTSGGIQAFWESEGGQKGQSKPNLNTVTVKANKIIALIPMTDELLEDAPAMASYVNRKAPEKIMYRVNDAIINGTGVGMPLGILKSAGTQIVAPESGQAADTVTYRNVSAMFYRLVAEARRRAVWLMNPDAEEQLSFMKFIDQGSGNAIPVYLPPGGLSASPYSTLFGRPIVTSEAMPALGDQGDIVFGDMSQYLTVTKGGIRQDVSIHLFFDYDITAFRFVLRIGGQPWWNAPVERPGGQTPRGYFVALGARAG